MPSGGVGAPSERPVQVNIAIFLLVINALLGLGVATFGLWVFENALSALGVFVALFAFWIVKGLMDGKPEAWLWAVILNFVAIVLYAASFAAIEGIVLCVLTLIYLNIPDVKVHFQA